MPDALADKFYNFRYTVKEGENFSIILKKLVKPGSIINLTTPMIIKMRRMNPAVKSWNNLIPGTELQIYIPKDYIDMNKYEKYSQLKSEEITPVKKLANYPTGFKASVYYMGSLGIFKQDSPKGEKISIYQISPVTIGLSGNYFKKDSPFSTSLSSYFSTQLAPQDQSSVVKLNIPPEIGANVFVEYRYAQLNAVFYAGPDYEKFSLINFESLKNLSNNYIDENSILYLTAGFSKQYIIFNKKLFTKTSLSKSILSTTKSSSAKTPIPYSAEKILFYLNYKLSDKLFIHTLFKYHMMSGPNKINALRIGIGFGYILF